MDMLSYCADCKRIFSAVGECTYCKSENVKPLDRRAPVNVIGTKLKGRFLHVKEGMAHIIFEGEKRVKSIKEFEADKLRKIIK